MVDRKRAPGRPRNERGAAALEFVLVTPILLLLIAGTVTLGLAGYAKFRMSDAAMVASRRCAALNPATCGTTAAGFLSQRWLDGDKVCTGGVQVQVTVADSMATVRATCAFTGGMMQQFLGLSNMSLATSAATPY